MTTSVNTARTGTGGGNPLPIYTFANLPSVSSVATGYKVRVSDIGANGCEMVSTGTRWAPVNGRILLQKPAQIASITNTEQLPLMQLFPAGSLKANDVLLFSLNASRSGTTDNGQASMHYGTAGTASDGTVTGLSSISILSSTNTNASGFFALRILGTTSVQMVNNTSGWSFPGAASTVAISAATTGLTDNSANAVYISLGLKSASTTNTVSFNEGWMEWITG